MTPPPPQTAAPTAAPPRPRLHRQRRSSPPPASHWAPAPPASLPGCPAHGLVVNGAAPATAARGPPAVGREGGRRNGGGRPQRGRAVGPWRGIPADSRQRCWRQPDGKGGSGGGGTGAWRPGRAAPRGRLPAQSSGRGPRCRPAGSRRGGAGDTAAAGATAARWRHDTESGRCRQDWRGRGNGDAAAAAVRGIPVLRA